MSKKLTLKNFISRARIINENKYDYSKTSYVSGCTKIIIICPIHGEFMQTPNHHLNKQGCPVCSGNQKLTINQFVNKSRVIEPPHA